MKILGRAEEQDVEVLQETALFNNLDRDAIKKILDICRKVRFGKNDIIMKEGEGGETIYLILDGTVEVAKNLVLQDSDDENVGNKVFTRLRAEDHPVFGEISLLEDTGRTATVRALSECTLYEVQNSDLLKLTEKDHELGYRIMLNLAKIVSSRLRKADEDLVKLTTVLSIVLKES